MKKFIESISNVWKIELKIRILITLGISFFWVYRFGAQWLTNCDATHYLIYRDRLKIGSILDMFTGGAFLKLLFLLWIMP
jgi:hypothetical protein